MKRNIKKEVSAFLKNSLVGVVATASVKGLPEAATVYLIINNNFDIYFVTQRSTRKFQNIMNNPRVAIVIGADLDSRTVQVEGTARLLDIGLKELSKYIERSAIAKIYQGKLPNSPFPYFNVTNENVAIFKVVPTWMRYMELDVDINKNLYYQIIG